MDTSNRSPYISTLFSYFNSIRRKSTCYQCSWIWIEASYIHTNIIVAHQTMNNLCIPQQQQQPKEMQFVELQILLYKFRRPTVTRNSYTFLIRSTTVFLPQKRHIPLFCELQPSSTQKSDLMSLICDKSKWTFTMWYGDSQTAFSKFSRNIQYLYG